MFGNKGCHSLHILQVHFSLFHDFISGLKISSVSGNFIFACRESKKRQVLKRTHSIGWRNNKQHLRSLFVFIFDMKNGHINSALRSFRDILLSSKISWCYIKQFYGFSIIITNYSEILLLCFVYFSVVSFRLKHTNK